MNYSFIKSVFPNFQKIDIVEKFEPDKPVVPPPIQERLDCSSFLKHFSQCESCKRAVGGGSGNNSRELLELVLYIVFCILIYNLLD